MEVGSARSTAVRLLFQLLDVGACNKGPAGADQNHGTDGLIARSPLDRRRNAFRHTRTQRVDGRIIDRDDADAVFHIEFDKFNHDATNVSYKHDMNFNDLIAIDTHVHLHGDANGSAADEAARKYFGHTGPEPTPQELAEHYRSRKIGCVVFSVDE